LYFPDKTWYNIREVSDYYYHKGFQEDLQVKEYNEQYVWRSPNHWKNIIHTAALPGMIVSFILAFFYLAWWLLLKRPQFRTTLDGIVVLIFIILGVLFYLAKRYLGETMDYTFSAGDFTIDKVLDESRRVRVAAFSMEKTELFAPVSHARYQGLVNDASVKKIDGYLEETAQLYFVLTKGAEGRELIVFQPNEEMVQLLAASNPEVSEV